MNKSQTKKEIEKNNLKKIKLLIKKNKKRKANKLLFYNLKITYRLISQRFLSKILKFLGFINIPKNVSIKLINIVLIALLFFFRYLSQKYKTSFYSSITNLYFSYFIFIFALFFMEKDEKKISSYR